VGRSPDEIRRLWDDPDYRPQYIVDSSAAVSFREAPGGRGTEIHVSLEKAGPDGAAGKLLQKLTGSVQLPRIKDELRRFKQHVETGVIPRSEGSPEGERAERKFKQRPAQPLSEQELQEVGT
jgi:hypothetical protein